MRAVGVFVVDAAPVGIERIAPAAVALGVGAEHQCEPDHKERGPGHAAGFAMTAPTIARPSLSLNRPSGRSSTTNVRLPLRTTCMKWVKVPVPSGNSLVYTIGRRFPV